MTTEIAFCRVTNRYNFFMIYASVLRKKVFANTNFYQILVFGDTNISIYGYILVILHIRKYKNLLILYILKCKFAAKILLFF